MSADAFAYDVFLSHSSRDETIVRSLAERLRRDGLRVWFSEWELQPGDSIPSKVDAGLEASRLLVFCMSENAFGSDWATLESQTFRFRDPLNKGRRFIPIRLDNVQPRGSLAQFLCVDWREEHRAAQYRKLLEACRPPDIDRESNDEQAQKPLIVPLEHTGPINAVAITQDGRLALSGSTDNTIRIWEVETGRCLRVLEGHTGRVWSAVFSRNGKFVLSGSDDHTVRLWETGTGRCLHRMRGHTLSVRSVAFSPDSRLALSGGADGTVRLWEATTGRCLRALEGHDQRVCTVAWSPRGPLALSGSDDKTIRIWNPVTGVCMSVLRGHAQGVRSAAWSPDAQTIVSGSDDQTVRLWKLKNGSRPVTSGDFAAEPALVLEGHTGPVLGVAFSRTGRFALSCSDDRTIRLWEAIYGLCVGVMDEHAGGVGSVACGPEDRLAISGSTDHGCRLWHIETRRLDKVLNGTTGIVTSASWSTEGRQVLTGSSDGTMRMWSVRSGQRERVFEGHSGAVLSVAWSPVGSLALSGSDDATVRIWDAERPRCVRTLQGHTSDVLSVAWSPDGWQALSGSSDRTLRLWEINTGQCLRVLEGHFDSIQSVAWAPNGRFAASGSIDNAVRLWNVDTGECLNILEGHAHRVQSVAWSPDSGSVLSGSSDNTLRLWDAATGRCLRVLEGHTGEVWAVAWSPDGRLALSGSCDGTVRVWERDTGLCQRVLEGHSDRIQSVAFGPKGRSALSVAVNGVMRSWGLEGKAGGVAGDAGAGTLSSEQQYTNAKVLLVGESGAGKTGLSMRLANDEWKESSSTVGAWATQWKLPVATGDGVDREIWLWDFGGQADQRLIHQLYMDETALAILVFDPQKEDLFDTLGQWDRDLSRAARGGLQKLLVAGRVDTGGLRASRTTVDAFARERGYAQYLETSARTGRGCTQLRDAVVNGIRWDEIPWRSSPRLFKRLKEEIIRLKDEGRVLIRRNDLLGMLHLKLAATGEHFTDEQLRAVVSLLTGPGVVWELAFGGWVLLQPERINAYAQAVIRTLRYDEHQLGCVPEERVLKGDLAYAAAMPRLPPEEERIVLLAMHQTLVERGLCLRMRDPMGRTLLVFPSYYGRERPDLVGHPAVFVSFHFNGFLDDIYATLVVRLHHSLPYKQADLWRYAADFKTEKGERLGLKLTRRAEGAGELQVYFGPNVDDDDKVAFTRYIHEHLLQKAKDVERFRHYVCPHCGTPVGNRMVAMKRLVEGKSDIVCSNCEDRVPLLDKMEQLMASPETRKRVRELQEQAKVVLVQESRARTLVGELISTVSLAGQLILELPQSRHGINLEVGLLTDEGEVSGHKLLLLLGESEGDVFQLRDEHNVLQWMSQESPLFLVVRHTDGDIRWMEITDWLRRETDGGKKPVKQIPIEGERFDVMSVRRWRDRILGGGLSLAAG